MHREFSQEDVLQMITEAKNEGVFNELEQQYATNLYKSSFFETIGIGRKEYYKHTFI